MRLSRGTLGPCWSTKSVSYDDHEVTPFQKHGLMRLLMVVPVLLSQRGRCRALKRLPRNEGSLHHP